MITAIRIVTPTGLALPPCPRMSRGRFKSGDGFLSPVELLLGLRGSTLQAVLEVDNQPAGVEVFDLALPWPAIQPTAAALLAAEIDPVPLAQAELLAAIGRAAPEGASVAAPAEAPPLAAEGALL